MINLFELLYSLTNDYGIAIITFTILIKLAMLPLTIKQKKSMKETQILSTQAKDLKEKHKNNSEKMNLEINKLYSKNPRVIIGFLLAFIQMPIFYMMYKLFSNYSIDVKTLILPWIGNLSVPDPYYILPLLYLTIQLLPNILVHFEIIKNSTIPKLTKSIVLTPSVITLLIITNLPAGMGIYFITNTIFSTMEQLFIKL